VVHGDRESSQVVGVGLVGSENRVLAAGHVQKCLTLDAGVGLRRLPVGQNIGDLLERGLGIEIADDDKLALLGAEKLAVDAAHLINGDGLDAGDFFVGREVG